MIESLVIAAIQDQRLIRLQYHGRFKTVAPHQLGVTENGVEALLCWQMAPVSPTELKWHVLELKKIYGLLVLDQKFEPPPCACHPPQALVLRVKAAL